MGDTSGLGLCPFYEKCPKIQPMDSPEVVRLVYVCNENYRACKHYQEWLQR